MDKTILIVDDDENYLNLLKNEFVFAGYSVIVARDGNEAFQKAKSAMPHMILLDVILAGAMGTTVVEMLKNDPQTKTIPVVVMSNYASRENEEKVLSLGAKKFIDKGLLMPKDIVIEIDNILLEPVSH